MTPSWVILHTTVIILQEERRKYKLYLPHKFTVTVTRIFGYRKGLPVGVTKGVPPKTVGPEEKGSKGNGGPMALGLPAGVFHPWPCG